MMRYLSREQADALVVLSCGELERMPSVGLGMWRSTKHSVLPSQFCHQTITALQARKLCSIRKSRGTLVARLTPDGRKEANEIISTRNRLFEGRKSDEYAHS